MLRAGSLKNSIMKDHSWFTTLDKCYDTGNGTYISKEFFIIFLQDCCIVWNHHDTPNKEIYKTYFQLNVESEKGFAASQINHKHR